MSKAKAKETPRPAPTAANRTVKRKNWIKEKFKRRKPPPKGKASVKAQQILPPQDAQQYSANWKTLQEV